MFKIYKDTAYMQAANCWLCLHIGSTALVVGRWLGGYGMRIEIATPEQRFRIRMPCRDKRVVRRGAP